MKLIILIYLMLILLISESSSQRMDSTRTLNDAIKNIFQEKHKNIFKSSEKECVENQLNLTQNGEYLVNLPQEYVILIPSFMKCSKFGEVEFLEQYLNSIVESKNEELTNCYKNYLKNLEPSSKLIKHFNKILTTDEFNKCKINQLDDHLEDFIKLVENSVGPIATFTCGVVDNYKKLTYFYIKSYLVLNEIDEKLREFELVKLTEEFKDTFDTIVECVMKDIKKSDLAHGLNSKYRRPTLNSLFNQKLQIISQNVNNTIMSQLYSSIDYDCVKSTLNLPKNGNNLLYKSEGRIVIASASLKCLKIDSTEFAFLFARIYASGRDSFEKYKELISIREDFAHIFTDIKQSTCGAFKLSDLENHLFDASVILSEPDSDLKTRTMTDLNEIISQKIHKASNCFTKRFN